MTDFGFTAKMSTLQPREPVMGTPDYLAWEASEAIRTLTPLTPRAGSAGPVQPQHGLIRTRHLVRQQRQYTHTDMCRFSDLLGSTYESIAGDDGRDIGTDKRSAKRLSNRLEQIRADLDSQLRMWMGSDHAGVLESHEAIQIGCWLLGTKAEQRPTSFAELASHCAFFAHPRAALPYQVPDERSRKARLRRESVMLFDTNSATILAPSQTDPPRARSAAAPAGRRPLDHAAQLSNRIALARAEHDALQRRASIGHGPIIQPAVAVPASRAAAPLAGRRSLQHLRTTTQHLNPVPRARQLFRPASPAQSSQTHRQPHQP